MAEIRAGMSAEQARAERALVLRALLAAGHGTALLGEGAALADQALASGQEAVIAAECEAKGGALIGKAYAAAIRATTARKAYAGRAGRLESSTPTNPSYPLPPATGIPSAADAGMAVLAAVSAAASYAKGDLGEARRLARNALRFATEASGGAVDWTLEEPSGLDGAGRV